MNNSTSLKRTIISLGYKFEPDEDEIYSYFIPKRILHGNKIAIPEVEEVDLYGSNKSPDDLFGSRQDTDHIYFFTSLKKDKPTHSRARRGAGEGKWHAQKPTPCVRLINDNKTEIGIMRQFTYQGGVNEWIRHEYAINADFLKLKLNDFPNYLNVHGVNLNPENTVFCHVYKKKAKKHQIEIKGEACQSGKKRKTIIDNNESDDVTNNNIIIVNDENTEDSIVAEQELSMNNNNVSQLNLQQAQPYEENIKNGNDHIQVQEDDELQAYWMENYDNFSLPEEDVQLLLASQNADDFRGSTMNSNNSQHLGVQSQCHPQVFEEMELPQQYFITHQESSMPNFFSSLLLD